MLFLRDIFPRWPPLKNALDDIFEVWYLKKYMIFSLKFKIWRFFLALFKQTLRNLLIIKTKKELYILLQHFRYMWILNDCSLMSNEQYSMNLCFQVFFPTCHPVLMMYLCVLVFSSNDVYAHAFFSFVNLAAPLICPCKEGLSFGNNDTYVLPFDKLSYLFKQKNSLIYSLKTQKCD